jgi:PAS domain S-box-containing protein
MVNGIAHCRMVFEDGQPKDFVCLAVNKAFERLTGLNNVVGRKMTEIIPNIRETDFGLIEIYGRVARTGVPEHFETYVSALQQWFSITAYSPLEGQFVAVFDGITERKKEEEELRTLSRTIEQSPVSIGITNSLGVIQYVNPCFTKACGYGQEELRGQTMRILRSGTTTPAQYREMWETITAGREWHGQFCNRKKSGELFWERESISPVFAAHGKITHFVVVKEDITERRELEEHLRRSQRMEAVGTLASGIAHDLNNILAPLLMAPDLLKETVKGKEERELLDLIEQNARRASNVVKQLLTFSRGSGGDRVPMQLQPLLKEMHGILAETFPRDITLCLDVSSNLLPVLGETTQLHQVLLNLFVNARDAMPDGGTLTVRAHNIAVDEKLARVNPPSKPGPHVVLTVTDTGHGMTPKVIERIFDPFFTTKGVGKGTGLGLSTMLGIVRSHGGFVTVESKPDEGTTFQVYLPADLSDPLVPESVPTAELPRGRNELILVVDDEPNVGEATRRVLESHGYRVLVAAEGEEALALFRLRTSEISLVLTDVMMPGMNGITMLREMHGVDPHLKALVTSGMTSDYDHTKLVALGITELLSKPYSLRELLEAIQSALSR